MDRALSRGRLRQLVSNTSINQGTIPRTWNLSSMPPRFLSSQALQKPGGKMVWNNSCYSGYIFLPPLEPEDLLGMKYGLK